MLRPSRSSFHTTTVSRAKTYFMSADNPARSSRVPDMTSENTFATPAAASVSFYWLRVCAAVETRVYRMRLPVATGVPLR